MSRKHAVNVYIAQSAELRDKYWHYDTSACEFLLVTFALIPLNRSKDIPEMAEGDSKRYLTNNGHCDKNSHTPRWTFRSHPRRRVQKGQFNGMVLPFHTKSTGWTHSDRLFHCSISICLGCFLRGWDRFDLGQRRDGTFIKPSARYSDCCVYVWVTKNTKSIYGHSSFACSWWTQSKFVGKKKNKNNEH